MFLSQARLRVQRVGMKETWNLEEVKKDIHRIMSPQLFARPKALSAEEVSLTPQLSSRLTVASSSAEINASITAQTSAPRKDSGTACHLQASLRILTPPFRSDFARRANDCASRIEDNHSEHSSTPEPNKSETTLSWRSKDSSSVDSHPPPMVQITNFCDTQRRALRPLTITSKRAGY